MIFPFREEMIPVLKWAIKTQPNEWKPKYYLGLIYWSIGRIDETHRLFKKCDENNFAPFYLALGYLDQEQKLHFYQKALSIDQSDWRNWHFLITLHNQQSNFQDALDLSKKATKMFKNEIVISVDYASTLYNHSKYQECLQVLNKLEVLPYEGGWEAHDLYKRANIQLAMMQMKRTNYQNAITFLEKSKEYPEQLGTGKPYDPDYRLQDYLQLTCFERMKDHQKAEKTKKSIYDFTIRNWQSSLKHSYFGYKILQQFQENQKLADLHNLWHSNPNNLTFQWYKYKLIENKATDEIEKKLINNPRFKIEVVAVKFIENEGY